MKPRKSKLTDRIAADAMRSLDKGGDNVSISLYNYGVHGITKTQLEALKTLYGFDSVTLTGFLGYAEFRRKKTGEGLLHG